LKKLLEYHTAGQTEITSNQAYICAGIITLLSAIRVLFLNWMLLEMSALGMKTRIACSSLIYRRILKFEKIALQKVTVGKVINLLSNDVNRLERAFALVHFLWIAPIEIVLGVSYMNITLGPAAVAGVGAITFCLLFQSESLSSFLQLMENYVSVFMSKKLSINRDEVALSTDNRIRLINDAVCGIQAIKMYSWERPFLKLVNAARK
jgi:ATP-binding cassette subfamily C (CFTR/MRP) protein 4